MPSWWWWWIPGLRKHWKLEQRRIGALSNIVGERSHVEQMAARPREVGDPLDQPLFDRVITHLNGLESEAKVASHMRALDDLSDDADLWGMFRGYLCPKGEVVREGELALSLLMEWGVPKASVDGLRETLGEDLNKSSVEARSALYMLFSEKDAWAEYTSEYESMMESYAKRLFGITVGLILLALPCYSWASRFPTLFVAGLLCAGTAGSCVSVMARMPAFDIRLSNELEAYLRRIICRIGVGVAASMIACAMLSWGVIPIAFGGQTFSAAIQMKTDGSCAPLSQATQSIKLLVLIGIPMLIGFSERALTWAESRLFSTSAQKHSR